MSIRRANECEAPDRLENSTLSVVAATRALLARMRRAAAAYVRDRAFQRAELELMFLDDRMLRDIGINRSEIGSAVRNPRNERINGAQNLNEAFMR